MKKFLSIVLSAAILASLGTSAAPGFAAEDDSAGLEEAIKAAREIVVVPEENTEFSYYKMTDEENGHTSWNLEWHDSEYNGSSSVAIDETGFVSNYDNYSYSDDDSRSGLGSTSLEEGAQTAKEFMARIASKLPESLHDYRLEGRPGYNLSYDVSFWSGDVRIEYLSASIMVDKYKNEVASYSFYGSADARAAKIPTEDRDKAITAEAAKAAYLEKYGIRLAYHTKYDYSGNEPKRSVFAAYSLEDRNGYIDALTGEKAELYRDSQNYFYAGGSSGMMFDAAAESADDSGAMYRLSPEEQEKVDETAGLLSKEDAISAVIRQVPGITADSTLTGTNVLRDRFEKQKYTFSAYFEDANAVIDAASGDLQSFYIYNYETDNKGGVSEAAAKQTAIDFVKNAAGDKYAEMELKEPAEEEIIIYDKEEEGPYSYGFNFVRKVNGIDYDGNGYFVTVNRKDGQIVSFRKRWYEEVEFPGIGSAAGEAAAFDRFNSRHGEFSLLYILKDKENAQLVYGFTGDMGSYVSFDASEQLDYNGEPYRTEQDAVTSYEDIAGRWYEGVVKRLLDNGYYIKAGEADFNGSALITQYEFLQYLFSQSRWYNDIDDFYKYVCGDIVKEDERAPEAELTRADAVKFAMRQLGLEKAAKADGIYRGDLFSDAVPEGYAGYAALAKGLGIVKGDVEGRFNGESTLTRAEAAQLIYNVLNA